MFIADHIHLALQRFRGSPATDTAADLVMWLMLAETRMGVHQTLGKEVARWLEKAAGGSRKLIGFYDFCDGEALSTSDVAGHLTWILDGDDEQRTAGLFEVYHWLRVRASDPWKDQS